MKAFVQSFLVAWRQLVRGGTAPVLLAAVALAHFLLPRIVRGDGTAAGRFETQVLTVTGAAAAVVLVTALVAACGTYAGEREARRLALSVVRPASAFAMVGGRFLAHWTLAAAALAFSALFTRFPFDPELRAAAGRARCDWHFAPALEDVRTCAARALKAYLADPKTPERVRKAPVGAVLDLLAAKESDRYDVIRPGAEFRWPFDLGELADGTAEAMAVRVRFATEFDLRTPFAGRFSIGGWSAAVSNATQSVVTLPLARTEPGKGKAMRELVFVNGGGGAVMTRPRRDLELLVPADGFAANLLRATLELLALAAALIGFGMMLSAAFSRPVAVFTAMTLLAAVLLAPGVAANYPDNLDAPWADRIGLMVTAAVDRVFRSFSGPSPVADLAGARAIPWSEVLKTAATNLFAAAAAFLAGTAPAIRRKAID